MSRSLIELLSFVINFAESEGKLTIPEHDLLADHVNQLECVVVRNEAIEHIRALCHHSINIPHSTAAGALAKVCMMLTLYGSKPDAMLHVIHDKGWPAVTLADVEAVRKFILEQ